MRLLTKAGLLVATAWLAACADVTPTATSTLSSPASATSSATRLPVPGRYIVVFKDGLGDVDDEARQVSNRHRGKLTHTYHAALKGMALALPDDEVDKVRAEKNVAYVELDQWARGSSAAWSLDRIDQRALPLNGVYSVSSDGSGVSVYIIDSGINYSHVEFGGRAVKGIDVVTPGGTAADCFGHGTHVAGTVGGATYGVAKNVRLVAVRVLNCQNWAYYSDLITGIDWVTANQVRPAVANISISGGFSMAVNQAIENSVAAGVTYAIAAGNDAVDACTVTPASAPSAITVGATDENDALVYFSNFGPCVKINAPGVDITSAWVGSNTATATIGGTSMAAPHVAGVAALYLSVNPSALPGAVRAALTGTATPGLLSSVPAGTPNLLVYTGVISPPPAPPTPRFTISCYGLTCNLDARSSSAGPGASFVWNFGDGTAAGASAFAVHTFARGGTYNVRLTVTDVVGQASTTQGVTVVAPLLPVANYTFWCTALSCNFDASSTTAQSVATYSWNWGDGTAAGSGNLALHKFAGAGTYAVVLTVTDGGGTSSKSQQVKVTRR